MKQKRTFLLLLVGLAVLIAAAAFAYSRLSENYTSETALQTEQPEETAPAETSAGETPPAETEETVYYAMDFTLLDGEGNKVTLSEFYGKPIVLNFWATWCGPCKSELPAFDKLAAEYGDEVVFMMINLTDGSRETVEGVKDFLSENGYTFPVYYDTELEASGLYGAYSIPASVFIYPDSTIYGGYIGAMSEELLRTCVEEILSK